MAVFHYVQLRSFAHQTEDPERVRAAMRHAAGSPDVTFQETNVEGGHKNRILILEVEVKRTADVARIFGALAEHDPQGFARVRDELDRRLDEELNFYLRLDKQEAYRGRLRLATADDAITLRAKVRSFASKRSGNQQDDARQSMLAFLAGVGSRDTTVGQ